VFNLHSDDSVRRAQNALSNTEAILKEKSLTPVPVHSLFEPEVFKEDR